MHSASNTNNAVETNTDSEIKKKSRIAALLMLLFWILMLGIPLFSYTFPLPEKPGILLSFGDEDGGGEQLTELMPAETESANTSTESSSAPQKERNTEATKQEASIKSPESKIEEVLDEDDFVKTVKKVEKVKEEVNTTAKKEDQKKIDAQKRADEEAAQKAKRDADAKAKKELEAAKKKEFGDLLSGDGDGSNNQKQGDPNGQPNQSKLDGLTTGKGKVGEGLSDRGVLYEPEIDENSQKVGRIAVRICVNSKGLVTESKYTQKGSTSTDLALIEVAVDAAKRYRFSPSGLAQQCGFIYIDFKLK